MRTTALAHIPLKENQNPPQVVGSQIIQPNSLGISSPATGTEEDPGSQAIGDKSLTTDADYFGVYNVYPWKPLRDPILPNTCSDPADSRADYQPEMSPIQGIPHTDMENTLYYHPFSNPSVAAMMVAHHSGTHVQSAQKMTQIAHILGSLGSDLNPVDLSNFNVTLEHKKLDIFLATAPESAFHHEDGWIESLVQIHLPLDKKKMPETEAIQFEVREVFHQDIIDVISLVYQSDTVRSFEHVPSKQFWRPSEDLPPKRLYREIYSSQAMLDTDEEICKHLSEIDSDPLDLEAVSILLLFYSDSTHLADFGTVSCWPVYLFFGSQSKYIRAMPTSSTCHHITYMPSVCCVQDCYFIS